MTKQKTDYTVQVLAPNKMVPESPTPTAFLIPQLILRFLVLAFTLSAVLVAVTARQSASFLSFVFNATYKDSSATRFQVGANAVACFFTFLSLLFLYGFRRPKSDPSRNYFQLLLHDMVMSILLISGCAAGTAVGYLAKYGQKQGGWGPICKYVDKFCDKITLSLALSYLAFLCMFMLTLMAAYKLKSQTTLKINTGEL